MAPLSENELLRRIRAGEDSFTEFKAAETSNDDLAKELCAFLNAHGGSVLIGIDDDGAIVGAPDWTEERVMNIARTAIDPAPIPSFQRVVLPPDDLVVVVVSVESGVEKPYARRSGESRRYYKRVGTTSREATREELIRLTQASGAVMGDARPVTGTSLSDVDDGALATFAEGRGIALVDLNRSELENLLRNSEILATASTELTVYGALLFGRDPQRFLPSAHIDLQAYPGVEVEEVQLDRGRAGGRLDQQIESAVAFISRNIARPTTVEGLRRTAERRPSDRTIRELVANAVAHRLYAFPGAILVRVFADRVEVTNPGSLPNGVTAEGMRLGAVTVRRNQLIMHRLAELGLVDANGRGILLMMRAARDLGLGDPIIEPGEDWTRISLPLC